MKQRACACQGPSGTCLLGFYFVRVRILRLVMYFCSVEEDHYYPGDVYVSLGNCLVCCVHKLGGNSLHEMEQT